MKGAYNVKLFFGPARPPGALGRGQKVKYHLISITKSITKILYQTLCVYSQMKDTKHSRQYFYFVVWVMPQGWDWGAGGAQVVKILFFFKHGNVAYQIDEDDEQNRMQVKFLS